MNPFYLFKFQLRAIWAALLSLSILISSSVQATNGYFSHGYGTHYKGLAGAGAAMYLNALGVATNPAGMAFLGSRVDLGFAFFNPNRQYSVIGLPSGYPGTFGLQAGTVESDSRLFVIPSLGINFSVPGGHALSFSAYGNGGMNTDYPASVFYGSRPTGVDLTQLFLAFTYAYQFVPKHALGVSGIVSYQFFEASGLEAFTRFSASPSQLTNNGHATSSGMGVRVGYLGEILPMLSVGASYQSKISMDPFRDYAGLFAEQGDFDIPSSWTVGVAVKPFNGFTVAADVQSIRYSEVKSVGNPLLPNLMQAPLGADGGAGFGWQDMTVYKLGMQWAMTPQFTLRGGYSFGEQPIPESEVLFNILAPGVIEQHATAGITARLSSRLEVNAAFMYAFSNRVTGKNPLEAPLPPGPQQIELKMNEFEGDFSLSIHL